MNNKTLTIVNSLETYSKQFLHENEGGVSNLVGQLMLDAANEINKLIDDNQSLNNDTNNKEAQYVFWDR